MENDFIKSILQQGSYFALFVGLGYWFLTTYLPKKDEDHRAQMAQLQLTFKESLDKVVASFERNTASINERLEIIEIDLSKIKKK